VVSESGGAAVQSAGTLEKVYNLMPSSVQDIFVSAAGWNFARKKFGKGFSDFLAHIEETQWWTKDELIEYQNEKLRDLIGFVAENSRFYRKVMQRAGVKPSDIKEVSDLKRLPYLEKDDIRNNLQEISPTHRKDLKLALKHTSGTTGTGMHFYWDSSAIMKEYAFVTRHRRWAGVEPLDLQATFGGRIVVPISRKEPPFWRTNLAERQVFFSMYHVSKGNAPHYLKKLGDLRPIFVQGYPSMLSTIATFSEEFGIPLSGPEAVFTSSETLLESQRALIEDAFQCKVFDWYGNSELCASIGQCERGKYHMNSEYGIVELDCDVHARERDTGEMICTSFINHGTPLLRYRIGDQIRLSSTKCPCGRGLPVVDSIIGRMDDIIVTPSGIHVGRMDHIFKDALNIREAQVIQESIEELRVLVVPRGGFNTNDLRALDEEFRFRLGDGMSIKFETVDMIPRESNGKFRSVISKIPRDAARV
jgi:phenylacetate-CoA ligase